MSLKVMPKTALPTWVNRLCAGHRVIGPRPQHGQYTLQPIQSAAELDLSYTTTVLPPKKVLLPPYEALVRFTGGWANVQDASVAEPPTVILGVHTCDLHAIQLLDHVFGEGYVDQHYQQRRENTLLVSIECLRPCTEHSFCKSMGTLGASEGFDLHLIEVDDSYVIDVATDRGGALLDGFNAVRDATEADVRRINQVLSEKWPRFSYRLDFDVTELPSLLSISYRSKLWDELGSLCLSCGMCTNVCPTCYCFNVTDEVDLTLQNGERIRMWDSCQLDSFALVAGGHDFRPTRAARQRHRFFRKGKYISDAHGLLGCVGCGRCAQACPVHISPVNTFNELYRRRITRPHHETEVQP